MKFFCPLLLPAAARLCGAASTLLRGGTIVAFDGESNSLQVIRDGSLLIKDDTILGIFESGQEPGSDEGDDEREVIDVTGKIITPGFVDTHRHGWQTSLKTLVANSPLWDYLQRFSEFAAAGLLTADDVYISQLAGLYESLNTGVTTIVDHAHHTWSNETGEAGLAASIESGARVFWAYTFHNVTNYTTTEQYAHFRAVADKASFAGTRTSLGIGCDYFGGLTPNKYEIQKVVDLALEYNVSVVSTHDLEGPFGARLAHMSKTVTNTPEDLHTAGLLNTSIPVIFSHATFLTFRGAELLRLTDQYVSLTIESEMHYGHTHPISHLILSQASLGVDTHAAYSGDLLTQARIWLQSVRATLFADVLRHWETPSTSPMSVNQAFLLATRNGGLALRRPDLGVIAVGAKADLVVWDGDSPALLGWRDPVAAVMLHASVADVEHVLVGGEFIKRAGKLTAKDYADVKRKFLESARRVQEVFIEDRQSRPPREGEVFFEVGAPLVSAMQVDVQRGDGTGFGKVFV